jgi:hypothetical protein
VQNGAVSGRRVIAPLSVHSGHIQELKIDMIDKNKYVPVGFIYFLTFFMFLVGCSRNPNGIEGRIIYFGTNKPAANITIEANIDANILKEEKTKSSKTTKTDASGHFKVTDLIPNKSYKIQPRDTFYQTTTVYATVFAKGVITIQQPIQIIPIPQQGIWIFTDKPENMKLIDGDITKKVQIRVHEGLIGAALGRLSAFSVSDEDIKIATTIVDRNSLLIVKSAPLDDFARLFKIPEKVVSLGSNRQVSIPEGWYYNISDFYGEDFMIVGSKLLKPNIEKPSIGMAVKSEEKSLWALPLSNMPSGVYILTTKIERENYGSVFGGENHPKEGYMIKID